MTCFDGQRNSWNSIWFYYRNPSNTLFSVPSRPSVSGSFLTFPPVFSRDCGRRVLSKFNHASSEETVRDEEDCYHLLFPVHFRLSPHFITIGILVSLSKLRREEGIDQKMKSSYHPTDLGICKSSEEGNLRKGFQSVFQSKQYYHNVKW